MLLRKTQIVLLHLLNSIIFIEKECLTLQKKSMKNLITLLSILMMSMMSYSQNDSIQKPDSIQYKILKSDGDVLIGKIIKQDAREVLFLTSDNREIYIPQHVIKTITPINTNEFDSSGNFVGEDSFATRYFITTNGLPIKKGEHYVQWNLFGPDFQFGLGKNFGVGVMTSWVGMPIIGTVKKSWEIGEKTQFALGGLVGTGAWAAPDFGGALPFATLSFGDRTKNIAFSGGYGAVWDGDVVGRGLASVAGMIKVSPKISLVFDSFILLPTPKRTVTDTYQTYVYNSSTGQNEYQTVTNTYETRRPGFALLIPGVRWHKEEGKAFQFGFSGVVANGDLLPLPIPMVQWYRTL